MSLTSNILELTLSDAGYSAEYIEAILNQKIQIAEKQRRVVNNDVKIKWNLKKL